MKQLLSILFAIILTSANAQTPDNSIIIGKIETIYSTILKEERQIFIYVPNANTLFAKKNYPVIYLFDGDSHFQSVTGMIQQLSQVNGNTILPEMIVVGITNTDRTRDLTPTHQSGGPYSDSLMDKTSGGGEIFTDFLEKELIPHIDSVYPTAPYRVLIGHSIGGVMVINTLLNHPNLFNAYISIDPSMWWDDQKLLKQAEYDLAQHKFDGETLFLAMANEIKDGKDTLHLRTDTSIFNLHSRSILELTDALRKNQKNNLKWNWKYYSDENHGSLPLIAEYDGLRFIFSFNKFQIPSTPQEFNSFNFDSAFVSHYNNVSKQMGYTVSPPEMMLNDLGYFFLQQNNFEKALYFFERNIATYPESINVYDSMGDYYNAKDDKQKAMEYYNLALTKGDSPDTKAKLENIIAGK